MSNTETYSVPGLHIGSRFELTVSREYHGELRRMVRFNYGTPGASMTSFAGKTHRYNADGEPVKCDYPEIAAAWAWLNAMHDAKVAAVRAVALETLSEMAA